MTASLIFVNARVLTMDGRMPYAEALAVAGNRIVAVGDRDTVLALAGSETRIVDAAGATLMPGFVESHLHVFSGAYGQTLLQLPGVHGYEALKSAVDAFASERPNEGLLLAQGADYEILGRETRLDRHALDRSARTGRWR